MEGERRKTLVFKSKDKARIVVDVCGWRILLVGFFFSCRHDSVLKHDCVYLL